MQSKEIKDSWYGCGCKPGHDPEHGPVKKAIHAVWHFVKFEILYPIDGFYHRYKERIGRSIAFARFGWLNYDFDAYTMYDLMQFKLKRIQKALIKGMAIQEKEDMDALQVAIKLTGRLYRGNYERYFHKLHDRKWGDMPDWDSEPADLDKNGKPLTFRLIFKERANVKTEEDKEQQRKDFLACYEQGEVLKLKDLDKLNEIFKKHAARWWD